MQEIIYIRIEYVSGVSGVAFFLGGFADLGRSKYRISGVTVKFPPVKLVEMVPFLMA